jgi:hypothetical protein
MILQFGPARELRPRSGPPLRYRKTKLKYSINLGNIYIFTYNRMRTLAMQAYTAYFLGGFFV